MNWNLLKKSPKQPSLKKANILKHQYWVKKYTNVDIFQVIFMDDSQMTFDVLDGWAKGLILANSYVPEAKRNRYGDRRIMTWAGIINQTIIRPFKVDEGLKLNSVNNCDFMDKIFFARYKSQSHSFKVKSIFLQDKTPSHTSKLTRKFFEHDIFLGKKIIESPPSSLVLNQTENLRSSVLMKLTEGVSSWCNG